jgi:hypothetical protein
LCIAITDGVWDDSEKCDSVLRNFRNAGVLTALAFMQDSEHYVPDSIDTHGCEVGANITDPANLFTLARNLVNLGVKRNLVNATA